MANFNVTINAVVNQPPSAVGDNSLTTNHATSIVFTTADFTTNTTPPYADPEGDPAQNLRVLTLPANGILNLNSVAVTINQIIPFTDIAAGNFTYDPDPSLTSQRTVIFSFEIADSGSGQYVG